MTKGRESPEPQDYDEPYVDPKLVCFKKGLKLFTTHVGLGSLVCGYAALGGYLFQNLEAGNELNECKDARDSYEELENKTKISLWEMSKTFWPNNLDEEDNKQSFLENLQHALVNFRNDTINIGYGGTDCEMMGTLEGDAYNWSFPGSLLFAVTIMTTIGYGNISPQTMWGKIIVIPYAMIGIPVMCVFLADIGDIMADMFKYIFAKVCMCGFCKKKKPSQDDDDSSSTKSGGDDAGGDEGYDSDDEDLDYQNVGVPLTVTLGFLAFYLIVGAAAFQYWEDWDWMESAYYSYITISTIGFGDFVPGVGAGSPTIEIVFAAFYIVMGLALLSMVFYLLQEEVANKLNKVAAAFSECKSRRLRNKNVDDKSSDCAITGGRTPIMGSRSNMGSRNRVSPGPPHDDLKLHLE